MPTLGIDDDLVGDLSVSALAELDEKGGTVADAVELYHALENPDEMLRGTER